MTNGTADDEHAVSIMTTLHYVTQTQRMGTISESTGRASMFLTSVSMALVALGFIAQATELSAAFYAFAFALIAVLLLIGYSTFLRLVQLGVEDGALAAASDRIKRFYRDQEPAIGRWFVLPPARNIAEQAVTVTSRFQLLMTASSMVAAVNGALAGVAGALILSRSAAFDLVAASASGAALFILTFAGQLIQSRKTWRKVEQLDESAA